MAPKDRGLGRARGRKAKSGPCLCEQRPDLRILYRTYTLYIGRLHNVSGVYVTELGAYTHYIYGIGQRDGLPHSRPRDQWVTMRRRAKRVPGVTIDST